MCGSTSSYKMVYIVLKRQTAVNINFIKVKHKSSFGHHTRIKFNVCVHKALLCLMNSCEVFHFMSNVLYNYYLCKYYKSCIISLPRTNENILNHKQTSSNRTSQKIFFLLSNTFDYSRPASYNLYTYTPLLVYSSIIYVLGPI